MLRIVDSNAVAKMAFAVIAILRLEQSAVLTGNIAILARGRRIPVIQPNVKNRARQCATTAHTDVVFLNAVFVEGTLRVLFCVLDVN